MSTEHPPLKLSVDGKTGEPLTYNDGHELKIAPIDRNSPLYVNVGGTGKEQIAAHIVLCVNSHDQLVKALKENLQRMERRYIQADLEGNPVPESHRDPLYHRTKAAIAASQL